MKMNKNQILKGACRLLKDNQRVRCSSQFAETTSTAQYCLDYVRNYDYENFICALLLKQKVRDAALAVRSFNIEISRISEQVSQETAGLMRLQFWDDTVDKCYSNDVHKVPKHPVALELFKAVGIQQFTKRHLKALIKSRRDNLKLRIFPNLDAAEQYAEQSVSSIYYFILEVNGMKNVNADHAASHLGKAQGLVQQLRGTPVARNINFIPIPQDVLSKHNVSHEDVLRLKNRDGLVECSYEISSRAYQHLVKARNLLKNVPLEARTILLPAVPVEYYLMKLQKLNYDVLHPSLQQKSRMWLPKVWYKSFRNEY